MNEEGDVPNVNETDKSTAPTLLQRFGSITGRKKGNEKKLTKENEDLMLEVDQLIKEAEERKAEIDRYKRELDANKAAFDRHKSHDEKKNLESEVKLKSAGIEYLKKFEAELKSQLTEMKNEIKAKSKETENLKLENQDCKKNLGSELQLKSTEIEHFKELQKIWMKSEAEFKNQLNEMKREIETKSEEIQNLKINVAVSENRISQLEEENKSNSAKIDYLNLEISEGVRKILEKAEATSIDPRNIHDKYTEMTIRARFPDISKLTRARVYSQPVELAGLNWRIYLYRNKDHLSFYVDAQNKNANKWSCSAFIGYLLISQKNVNIVHSGTVEDADLYSDIEGNNNWGYNKFISFKDLFNEGKVYVKDNSITVAAVIKAFPNADQ